MKIYYHNKGWDRWYDVIRHGYYHAFGTCFYTDEPIKIVADVWDASNFFMGTEGIEFAIRNVIEE